MHPLKSKGNNHWRSIGGSIWLFVTLVTNDAVSLKGCQCSSSQLFQNNICLWDDSFLHWLFSVKVNNNVAWNKLSAGHLFLPRPQLVFASNALLASFGCCVRSLLFYQELTVVWVIKIMFYNRDSLAQSKLRNNVCHMSVVWQNHQRKPPAMNWRTPWVCHSLVYSKDGGPFHLLKLDLQGNNQILLRKGWRHGLSSNQRLAKMVPQVSQGLGVRGHLSFFQSALLIQHIVACH